MTSRAQKFGGSWSVLKVETVAAYLQAYVNALKNQPFSIVYVDAFAGSGSFSFATGSDAPLFDEKRAVIEHAGSAKRALQIVPPFKHLYFIELRKKNVEALESLADSEGRRADCSILSGDANERVREVCAEISKRPNVRGVIFLDPFGMELEWATLSAIADTKALDVWYLFPLGGVLRNSPHEVDALNPSMVGALNRGLGTDVWKEEFYKVAANREPTLFETAEGTSDVTMRALNADSAEAFIKTRLETVFPRVLKPRRLLGHNNSPAFSLFFALSNPNPKAWNVAERIAGHLLKPR